MKKATLVLVALALLLGGVGQAKAGLIILNDIERGAYESRSDSFGTGGSGTATGNYLTGAYGGAEYRSFFNFDLSSVSGTITSAQLLVSISGTFGQSPNPTETLGIFDVTTSIPALRFMGNWPGRAVGTAPIMVSHSPKTEAIESRFPKVSETHPIKAPDQRSPNTWTASKVAA